MEHEVEYETGRYGMGPIRNAERDRYENGVPRNVITTLEVRDGIEHEIEYETGRHMHACSRLLCHLHGLHDLESGRDVHVLMCPVVVDHRRTPRARAVVAETLSNRCATEKRENTQNAVKRESQRGGEKHTNTQAGRVKQSVASRLAHSVPCCPK